jgi:hypothetical protein
MATTRINGYQQFTTSADVSFNSFKITNLANPVNPQDAATKAYVDSTAQGLDVKLSVRAASTANLTLSGVQTVDGVSLSVGDRVLVKNQTTASANGIYVVASGAWSRAIDADGTSVAGYSEVSPGMFTFVEEGTTLANTGWVLSTSGTITVGTTSLAFAQFSGAGTYLANNGVQLVGNTFSAVSANSARISVTSAGIDLATVASVSGTYGNTGYNVPNISVDGYGRISAAANRDIFGTIAANLIFGGPSSGSAASPTFRSLVLSDLIVGLAPAATVSTVPSNGQLLIGNGTAFALATLATTTGISVTNGVGTITINNTGVTSLAGTANQISVSASTGAVTIAFTSTVTFPGRVTFAASTTSASSFNIPTGTAPTSPVAGDVWLVNTNGIYAYYNTATHLLADLDSTQTLTNKTLSSGVTYNGNVILTTYGGTGLSSYAAGDIMYYSTGTAFTKISIAAQYSVLVSSGAAPAWGSINLASSVAVGSSILNIANGGTGLSATPTNGQIDIGNGTGFTRAAISSGNGVTVTNGAGSITLSIDNTVVANYTRYKVRETPTGTINSVNATFTTSQTPITGKEMVFTNGVLQAVGAGADYTISGTSITFNTGSIPQTGDSVVVTYFY